MLKKILCEDTSVSKQSDTLIDIRDVYFSEVTYGGKHKLEKTHFTLFSKGVRPQGLCSAG